MLYNLRDKFFKRKIEKKIVKVTAAIFVNDGMLIIAKRKPTARLPNL